MKQTLHTLAHVAEFTVSLMAPLAFLYMPFWLPFVV